VFNLGGTRWIDGGGWPYPELADSRQDGWAYSYIYPSSKGTSDPP